MSYASGKKSWGISDRSGRRYRLKDMKKEWTGSLVGPDEFEPKHPQLFPTRSFSDPQALRNARPDKAETLKVFVNKDTVETPKPTLIRGVSKVGEVTVTTT